MFYDSIISVDDLNAHLNDPDWVIVDCHFVLSEPETGKQAYLKGHIPGAIYAHLNQQLSGKIIPGKTGRHPLPEVSTLAETFSSWGINRDTQVIAYDDGGGKIAARLWWLLHWLGHKKVAVLDGGLKTWKSAGLPLDTNIPQPARREFIPEIQPQIALDLTELESFPADLVVVDSRAPERYAGKIEPIDPVAGHIPGARNLFFQGNLKDDEHFLPVNQLRVRFSTITGETSAENVVFYCGSGVTAAHNVLAMYAAGLGMPKLYPGSWSGWIADPARPVAKDT